MDKNNGATNQINSKRLAQFREVVDDMKAAMNRTEGERDSILGVLKDKYKIGTIAEARKRIETLVPEIDKKQKMADDLTNELNTLLDEIETELK